MSVDVTRTSDPANRAHSRRSGVTLLFVGLVVSAIAMICAGAWVGEAVTDGVGRSELGWRSAGYPATAFTLEAGPVTPSTRGDGLAAPRQVTLRWIAPDGTERRGDVVLPAPVAAGAPVPVLVGADGTPHPQVAAGARTAGFVAGVTGALLGWIGIWVGGIAARELLIRHRNHHNHHRYNG